MSEQKVEEPVEKIKDDVQQAARAENAPQLGCIVFRFPINHCSMWILALLQAQIQINDADTSILMSNR